MKFKVGDRVRLNCDVHSAAGFKRGAETIVIRTSDKYMIMGRHQYGSPVVNTKSDVLKEYLLFESTLELAAPLTPFEQAVQAYIKLELHNA